MQTKGGVMAQSGGKIEKFWPKKTKPRLTFTIMRLFVDWSPPWTLSPGHWIGHQGHLASLCVMTYGGTWMIAALEHVRTKINNYMGGPGNRTQVPVFARHVHNHYAICNCL